MDNKFSLKSVCKDTNHSLYTLFLSSNGFCRGCRKQLLNGTAYEVVLQHNHVYCKHIIMSCLCNQETCTWKCAYILAGAHEPPKAV